MLKLTNIKKGKVINDLALRYFKKSTLFIPQLKFGLQFYY